ncbi:unnamed protein product [Caenorhabditis brenneri]
MFDKRKSLKIPFLFKGKPKETFPLNRLPLIVRNQVIRSLKHKDCINLSMASKKAAETVRIARIKTTIPKIDIKSSASIKLWGGNMVLYQSQKWKNKKGKEIMKPKELKKWTNQSNNSVVEKTAKVYNEIQSLFRFNNCFSLYLSSGYKKVATLEEILNDPIIKNNCILYYYKKKKTSAEELKVILDTASFDKSFTCYVKHVPIDFEHENAFKFGNIYYLDARWMKIENLYGMNSCGDVTLCRTNFTQPEIKAFVNHWVNSDIEMFLSLEILSTEPFEATEIFDWPTVLHIGNSSICFAMSKTSETRKKTLLSICKAGSSGIMLSAWAPGEYRSGVHPTFDEIIRDTKIEFDLLMEKERLKTKWDSSEELKQVYDKLKDRGVIFINGRATMELESRFQKL